MVSSRSQEAQEEFFEKIKLISKGKNFQLVSFARGQEKRNHIFELTGYDTHEDFDAALVAVYGFNIHETLRELQQPSLSSPAKRSASSSVRSGSAKRPRTSYASPYHTRSDSRARSSTVLSGDSTYTTPAPVPLSARTASTVDMSDSADGKNSQYLGPASHHTGNDLIPANHLKKLQSISQYAIESIETKEAREWLSSFQWTEETSTGKENGRWFFGMIDQIMMHIDDTSHPSAIRERRDQLQQELNEAISAQDESDNNNRSLRREIESLQARNENLIKALDERESHIQVTATTLSQMKEDALNHKKEVSALKERHTMYAQEVEGDAHAVQLQHEEKLKDLKDKLAQANSSRHIEAQSLKDKSEAISATKIRTVVAQLENTEAHKQRLEAHIIDLVADHAVQLEAVKTKHGEEMKLVAQQSDATKDEHDAELARLAGLLSVAQDYDKVESLRPIQLLSAFES